MLALTKEAIESRAIAFAAELKKRVGGSTGIEIVRGESVIGGGSAPDTKPQTTLVTIVDSRFSADEIEARLRSAATPVIARIENERVVIDLRTVAEDEEELLIKTISEVLA